MRPLLAALLLALAWSAVAGAVRADDKQACIAASEDAQQLRLDGKLLQAQKRLLDCAKPSCPAIVREDCTQWMADVVASIPTVVLGARDAQGRDVLDGRAWVDGAPAGERLDGRPIALDPGLHRFRLESASSPNVAAEVQVLVRAGEKNREITATLAGGSGGVQDAPSADHGPLAGEPHRSVPAVAWVFGGIGVAALGTALAFDVAQALDYDHLSSTCAGHCSPDDVDHVATERWVAGIAAGVGALSLGAAAWVLLARPTSPPSSSFVVTPLPGGGAMGAVDGRF